MEPERNQTATWVGLPWRTPVTFPVALLTSLSLAPVAGDTMNTASRMESTSQPGFIQVSETTYLLLEDAEPWQPTGVSVWGIWAWDYDIRLRLDGVGERRRCSTMDTQHLG